MKNLIILLAIILPLQLLSQNKLECKRTKFRIDSIGAEYQTYGFMRKNLAPILVQNPLAYREFERYKKTKIIGMAGTGLSAIGFISILTAFATSTQSSGSINFGPSLDENKVWLITLGGISFWTGMAVSIPSNIIAKIRYNKAIKIFNSTNYGLNVNHKRKTPIYLGVQYVNSGARITLTF